MEDNGRLGDEAAMSFGERGPEGRPGAEGPLSDHALRVRTDAREQHSPILLGGGLSGYLHGR